MAAILIIPASFLGFTSAMLGYFVFEMTALQAASTYFTVTITTPAALLLASRVALLRLNGNNCAWQT